MKKILIVAFFIMTNQAMAKNVAIFNGAGTCDGCAEAVAKFFDPKTDKVVYLNEKTLSDAVLSEMDLYVQPGGSDDINDTLKKLKPAQVQAIREFVAHGGGYLGICAGAYLAARYSSKKDNQRAYGLVSIDELDSEIPSDKPTLLPITWLGESRLAYNQSGPHMGTKASTDTMVLARYTNSNRIAAQKSAYKNGTVILIGPHFEADQSWCNEDGINDPACWGNGDLLQQALKLFPSDTRRSKLRQPVHS